MTITGVRSPVRPSFLTNEYATPAPRPPRIPVIPYIKLTLKEGFTTKSEPANVAETISHSKASALSSRTYCEAIIAKNGESLLSIFASARFI